jgi:hypothetical protein
MPRALRVLVRWIASDHNGPFPRPAGSLMHLLLADLAVFRLVGGQKIIECLQTLIVLSF